MGRHQKKGNRMRQIRLERGLTLENVAADTHYCHVTIGRAETMDQSTFKRKDIRRDAFWETMSNYYGVPAEELRRRA